MYLLNKSTALCVYLHLFLLPPQYIVLYVYTVEVTTLQYGVEHRVCARLFLQLPNWDPHPPPHQQASVSSPPLVPGGHSC